MMSQSLSCVNRGKHLGRSSRASDAVIVVVDDGGGGEDIFLRRPCIFPKSPLLFWRGKKEPGDASTQAPPGRTEGETRSLVLSFNIVLDIHLSMTEYIWDRLHRHSPIVVVVVGGGGGGEGIGHPDPDVTRSAQPKNRSNVPPHPLIGQRSKIFLPVTLLEQMW